MRRPRRLTLLMLASQACVLLAAFAAVQRQSSDFTLFSFLGLIAIAVDIELSKIQSRLPAPTLPTSYRHPASRN